LSGATGFPNMWLMNEHILPVMSIIIWPCSML